MEKFKNPGNTLLLFCLATVFTVAACSTTGMQRSEDVQSAMQTVDNDINSIIVQLDDIGASLDELTKPSQTNLKEAFDRYSDNVSKIEKMEKDFAEHASHLEESGEAYFNEWEKNAQNYENPDIQRQSEQRRAELSQTYDKIAQNNVGVKEAFRTYVSDVNEIEQFLSNDLTSDGIDSISRTANNVIANGTNLKSELQNLQSAIEEAREKMQSS